MVRAERSFLLVYPSIEQPRDFRPTPTTPRSGVIGNGPCEFDDGSQANVWPSSRSSMYARKAASAYGELPSSRMEISRAYRSDCSLIGSRSCCEKQIWFHSLRRPSSPASHSPFSGGSHSTGLRERLPPVGPRRAYRRSVSERANGLRRAKSSRDRSHPERTHSPTV